MTRDLPGGNASPLHDLLYVKRLAVDVDQGRECDLDVDRILRMDAFLRFKPEYSVPAAALSETVFGDLFVQADITAFDESVSTNDPRVCVCCFFADLVAVARLALDKDADVPAVTPAATRDPVRVDGPGTANLGTVIPGDAKAASRGLLYGDATPLVFKLTRPNAVSDSRAPSSPTGDWRLQPYSARAAVVSLAAGPSDAVDVLHVRSDSKSAIHDASISLVEGGATVRVSDLPKGSDARDLRLRVEGVLLRPTSASTPDAAVFLCAEALTGMSPASGVLEVELYDPSMAAQIETNLEGGG